jgi:hypothetical protein
MSAAFPLRGLPPFIFGMRRDEVLSAAGEPDAVEAIESEFTGAAERWIYLDRGIQITFGEEEQWRLEAIDVEDLSVTIEGVRLLGVEAINLAQQAAHVGIPDVHETDDHGEFGKCYESTRAGLLFWVVDGVIVNFTMFPEYDEGGEVVLWPGTQ